MTLPNYFTFRPNTSDQNIFISINEHNEYRLPNTMNDYKLVVDIGMHIGSFSHACLVKGAQKVIGFEAWKENFELAQKNLSSFSNHIQINKAVWRSDEENTILYFQQSSDIDNTGGGNVLFQEKGTSVETISLDNIIDTYGEIDLLKLDCEGSEFPILLSSSKLGKVKSICGEYHEMGGAYNPLCGVPEKANVCNLPYNTINELYVFLDSQGFKNITHYRHGNSSLGMFFASRD